jgi:hypothetical protein
MKKYKLTNQNLQTHNGFQWEVGKVYTVDGAINQLCNRHWFHYYHSPELAILLNPIHAGIINPRLWEVSATGKHLDDCGIKGGCTKMKIIKEIEIPEVTMINRVAFGILCAKAVYKETEFNEWADKWLSSVDRSSYAAYAAASADYAAYAAASADYAAYAAACAAANAAANAADCAARAAAYAARAAAYTAIDLVAIAKEAMKIK